MARCPLCSERPAKRYCPAKETRICPVCCGSKREIEIDCPSSCHHLLAGRAYEDDMRTPAPQLASTVQGLDQDFIYRNSLILNNVCGATSEERTVSPWLVDGDVIEVLTDLTATMKTLASGIYYETLPDSTVGVSLFRRLKNLFDEFMEPQPQSTGHSLTVSEAIEVLNFLTYTATVNSNTRPRSRQYLDLLTSMAQRVGPANQAGNLIVP